MAKNLILFLGDGEGGPCTGCSEWALHCTGCCSAWGAAVSGVLHPVPRAVPSWRGGDGSPPAGMGVSTVTAARILKGQLQHRKGEESLLEMDKFPYVALAKVSPGAGAARSLAGGRHRAELKLGHGRQAALAGVLYPVLCQGSPLGTGGLGPLLSCRGCFAGENAPFVVKLQAPAPSFSQSLQGMLVGVKRSGFSPIA